MNCPTCGYPNEESATKCINCGSSLQKRAAEASQQEPPPQQWGPPQTQDQPQQWGPPQQQQWGPPGQPHWGPPPPVQNIPNYLVQSIVVTILCCVPAGVVAIIYAAQVNSKIAVGDYAGAMQASKNAKIWSWVSFGLGLLVLPIAVIAAVMSP